MSAGARDYERFRRSRRADASMPPSGSGSSSPAPGGTGWARVGPPKPNSEVLNNTTFGVLELTLHAGWIRLGFRARGRCHVHRLR